MGSRPSAPVLHSRYDPIKEASRFVDAQNFGFTPAVIVVTEPGESFLAQELSRRFPDARLIGIRYQDDFFLETDSLWHVVWRPSSGLDLVTFLFNHIPDELLPVTLFLSWKPSDAVWPDKAQQIWKDIASLIRLEQNIMRTRAHFGKRWFTNMIWNAGNVSRIISAPRTNKSVLLAAAGPSLDCLTSFNCDCFYLIAVSAAVQSLLYRGYYPDLCIATDGGYWANEHLQALPETISLAFPLEAAVPSAVLKKNQSTVLGYGSLLENSIAAIAGFTLVPAVRNGTVSGTAALYALDMSTAKVYAAGLDLASSDSFAHTRPYSSDTRVFAQANRVHPDSTSLYEQNVGTSSLDIYASWFASRDACFRDRFVRIGPVRRIINGIKTLDAADFDANASEPLHVYPGTAITIASTSVRSSNLREWLEGCIDSLAPFSGTHSPGDRDRFAVLLRDNPVLSEILETISYGSFLQYQKKVRSARTEDDHCSIVSLVCRDSIDCMRKNAKRLACNE